MKTLLILLALLIGLNDGSIVIFPGFPLITIDKTDIVVEGISFPFDDVKAMRFVPDNLVM